MNRHHVTAQTVGDGSDPFEHMLTPEDWMRDALCAQLPGDLWFPEKGEPSREARKICVACDVRDQCLEWALRTNQQHGILGGLSAKDRRKIQRGRAA